jgi:hypothetical protein
MSEFIQEVEKICKEASLENDEVKRNELTMIAVDTYKTICLNDGPFTNKMRLDAILSMVKNIPEEGHDMLSRLRDAISVIKNKPERQAQILEILESVSKSNEIEDYERMKTAVCIYNNFFIDVCYSCFSSIASDPTVSKEFRVEACRFLFASESTDNQQLSQECLIEIIENLEYSSLFRYSVIAGYIAKTGIFSMMNSKKLKIPYDERFVYCLQTLFFNNGENGIRERILSGQHMLDMECVEKEERDFILETLISISQDPKYSENERADAADVVIRLGDGERSLRARDVVVQLGFSAVNAIKDTEKITTSNMMNRVKTMYTNSQNVHETKITESINSFIERVISESPLRVYDYPTVHKEVVKIINNRKLPPEQRYKALKALNRVKIDTATYTRFKVTTAEVLVYVWHRIQTKNEERKKHLSQRLIEELIDMDDTCSSGHAGRFINVLTDDEDIIKITWESQIVANLAGRINAKIRDMEDKDLQEKILAGMSSLGGDEDEDRKVYLKYIPEVIEGIRGEMTKEFVGGRFVTQGEFETSFMKGRRNWIS